MVKMNYEEILSEIRGIVDGGDEYIGGLINLEKIKAVAAAGRSYVNDAPIDDTEAVKEINGLFMTIEDIVLSADSKFINVIQLIINAINGKITPEGEG